MCVRARGKLFATILCGVTAVSFREEFHVFAFPRPECTYLPTYLPAAIIRSRGVPRVDSLAEALNRPSRIFSATVTLSFSFPLPTRPFPLCGIRLADFFSLPRSPIYALLIHIPVRGFPALGLPGPASSRLLRDNRNYYCYYYNARAYFLAPVPFRRRLFLFMARILS